MDNEKDIFSEDNVAQNNWIKFSVIGDYVHGTLTAVREMTSRLPGKEGQTVKVYEVKADGGEFHDTKDKQVLEPAVKILQDEIWNIGGSGPLDNYMRKVKIGQKFGVKFTEIIPNKNKALNPFKNKKVYLPKNEDGSYKMDKEWLDANSGVSAADTFGAM